MTRDDFMSMLGRHLWRWLFRCVIAVAIVSALRSSIGDWSDVPSRSMTPTILPGDRIYVNKLAYDLKLPFTTRRLASRSNPHRGDIVVLQSPTEADTLLVKRIIGIPGDQPPGCGEPIPPGKYFVEGDNRQHSFDSRQFGLIDRRQIRGRATSVLFSLDPARHSLPRVWRFLARVP